MGYTINRKRLEKIYAWLTALAIAFLTGYMLGHDKNTAASIKGFQKINPSTSIITSSQISSGFITSQGSSTSTMETNVFKKKSLSELLGIISLQRRTLKNQLMKEFGEFSNHLFHNIVMEASAKDIEINKYENNPNIPTKWEMRHFSEILKSSLFSMNDLSRTRLMRRFMIKILSTQFDEDIPTFVWVSAGDSVAAGHGNLHRQSYTSILEETVQSAFRSIGIHFIAKNRGIGGYTSGPELSFCMESIYGSHIDILSWDFQTMEIPNLKHDAESMERILLWGNRAGIHPTKPIMMLMDNGKSDRWDLLQNHFENSGLGTILMDSEILTRRIINIVPDENKVTSNPFSLQYLVCNGHIEGSATCADPSSHFICNHKEKDFKCIDNKFHTKDACQDISKHQTSWNPGTKFHFLKGRLLGYFILEILNDAILQLDLLQNPPYKNKNKDQTDDFTILQNLLSQDNKDYMLFSKSSPLSDKWNKDEQGGNTETKQTLLDLNPFILFRAHSICHTALLPSDMRYNNILDSPHEKKDQYFIGYNRNDPPPSDGDQQLSLFFDPSERPKCDLLEKDFKDYFGVRYSNNWHSIEMPNAKEIKAYGTEKMKKQGFIMICLRKCLVSPCPKDTKNFDLHKHLKESNIEIEVEDKKVTGVKNWNECHFLEGKEGLKWGEALQDKYDIHFKVNKKEIELQISSIIIF